MKDIRREVNNLRLGTFLLSLGLFINPTILGVPLGYLAFIIGMFLVFVKSKDLKPYTEKFEKIKPFMVVGMVVGIIAMVVFGILNAEPTSAINQYTTALSEGAIASLPALDITYFAVGWAMIPVNVIMYGCVLASYFYIVQGLEEVSKQCFAQPAIINIEKAKKSYKLCAFIFLGLMIVTGLIDILYLNEYNKLALNMITFEEFETFAYKVSAISIAYSIFDVVVWGKSLRINRAQKILTQTAVIPDPNNPGYQQQPNVNGDAINVEAKVKKEEKVEKNDYHHYDDEIR